MWAKGRKWHGRRGIFGTALLESRHITPGLSRPFLLHESFCLILRRDSRVRFYYCILSGHNYVQITEWLKRILDAGEWSSLFFLFFLFLSIQLYVALIGCAAEFFFLSSMLQNSSVRVEEVQPTRLSGDVM